MATIYWTNLAGGYFTTATNWSTGTVPGASDQARINANVAVEIPSATDETVLSLTTASTAGLQIDSGSSLTMLEGTGLGANAGLILISDGGGLQAGGTIDNTAGYILLNSIGHTTELVTVPGEYLTLSGGGHVAMSDNTNNELDITTNVNNTISGAGTVSLANNEKNGVIDASAPTTPLLINTSDQTLVNAGTLEATGATGAGGLFLHGTIDGSSGGLIEANNGNVYLDGVTLIGGTLDSAGAFDVDVLAASTFNGITTTVNNASFLFLSANLALEGTFNNTGLIESSYANIAIDAAGATLKGSGKIFLGSITSNSASATLTNASTIAGKGFIGNSGSNTLILINKGVINGNDAGGPLIIDTGTKAVTNTSTLEATDSGGPVSSELYIASPVTNAGGYLIANDGNVVAAGAVTGGRDTIQGNGTVEFEAASNVLTTFAAGSTGGLILDDASQYTGSITGFGANTTQSIDLPNVLYATVSKAYSGGVLTIKDTSGDIAHLNFIGTYKLSSFTLANDGHGGTLITDPTVIEQSPGNAPSSIPNDAVLEVNTPDKGSVTFKGPTGTLLLDQPATFTGAVSGFAAQDHIDLSSIAFGANTTLGYSQNSNGGTLSVTNGTHSASIALLGNYMASSFVTSSDGHGGTLITEASQTAQQPLLTHPHV